jgi:hypothetical protein
MASAGRILIIPKGAWSAETEYEMLDLVFHNGTSWLAKKNVVGIEPTEVNVEYWHKLCDSADLTEVNNRIAALENKLLSAVSLDDIDLSSYALKSDVTALNESLVKAESDIVGLNSILSNLKNSQMQIKTYVGSGGFSEDKPTSVSFDFAPDVVILLGFIQNSANAKFLAPSNTSYTCYNTNAVMISSLLTTEYKKGFGFCGTGSSTIIENFSYAKKSDDGKTFSWYQSQYTENAHYHFGASNYTYYVLGLKV